MIPYEIDPSLYTAEPEPPVLDDGFSTPHHGEPAVTAETPPATDAPVDAALLPRNPF